MIDRDTVIALATSREIRAIEPSDGGLAGIIEQRERKTKSKHPRPIVMEYRPSNPKSVLGHKWRKWGAYRTEEEANQTMQIQSRKYSFYEWRIKPKE